MKCLIHQFGGCFAGFLESVLSFGRPKCHFLVLENGHFRQKCPFSSSKKWHFQPVERDICVFQKSLVLMKPFVKVSYFKFEKKGQKKVKVVKLNGHHSILSVSSLQQRAQSSNQNPSKVLNES